jgi:DNA-directed RNA polymerase subunit RPC12/RpoP
MDTRRFPRSTFGELSLDLCRDCHVIWFDQYESAQLAPGAVIDLFRLIHEQSDRPARPLGSRLACPRCSRALVLTHDFQRSNRIVYHRCEQGHGRLSSYMQFLREKNFVRSLTVPEIAKLRERVAQVRCSGCGAPVDLSRDAACAYCGSPIAVLDADAVAKTIAELSSAEARRTAPDPDRIAEAFLGTRVAKKPLSPWLADVGTIGAEPPLVDLIADGLAALFD